MISNLLFYQLSLSLSQVCHSNPGERSRFIRCIYNLLQSSSPAVRYEAAGTLVTLSSTPTAVKVCGGEGEEERERERERRK